MKRPWLTTQAGQRASMLLATLLSIALLIPLALQLNLESSRSSVKQLDSTNITYCELASCGELAAFQQIEPLAGARVTEGEFGTEVIVEVINHGRLNGRREVWAVLRTKEGKIVEGLKIWLELSPKGRNAMTFFFTGTAAEFNSGVLNLGF